MRRSGSLAALLAVVLLVAGCGETRHDADARAEEQRVAAADASARAWERCAAAALGIVAAVQGHVDTFAVSTAAVSTPAPDDASTGQSSEETTAPAPATDTTVQSSVDAAQQLLDETGCDPRRFAATLEEGLADVSADGVLAGAVLERTSAALTGRAADEPVVREVAPGEDLSVALAESPTGSTLVLAAGTYELNEPLVLLGGTTLEGAGADRTVLTSDAPEASILVLTGERVEIRALGVERTGETAGSGIVAAPSASLLLEGVRVSGAVSGNDAVGGAGVHMSAPAGEAAAEETTLEVTDSQFADNDWAGIAVSGGHRTSIATSTFAGNAQCGMCFLDSSSGSVEGSTFTDNAVGLVSVGGSHPAVVGNTFAGGEVAVQAGGSAAPDLADNTITSAARAALIFTEEAGGSLTGTTCAEVPYGIVVGPAATPVLRSNDCVLAASG